MKKYLSYILTICLILAGLIFASSPTVHADGNPDSEALLKTITVDWWGAAAIYDDDVDIDYIDGGERLVMSLNNQDRNVYLMSICVDLDVELIPEFTEGASCKVDGVEYQVGGAAPKFNAFKDGWNIIEVTSKDKSVTNKYYILHIGDSDPDNWEAYKVCSYWNFIPEPAEVTLDDKELLNVIKSEFEKQIEKGWPADEGEDKKNSITKKIDDDLVKIEELEKAEADRKASEEFTALVEVLKGDGTDSDEAIAAAKAAYEALSPEAKELAKDAFSKLEAAEKAVEEKKSADEAAKKAANVKTGETFKVGKNNFKVTKISGKAGEVAFVNCTSKKLTKVTIPATVNYKGSTFKVTSIQKNALKGYKKLKTVTIGKNITNIGTNAFSGDAKLKKITVKSTGLKKVGAKALKGIHKKAVIKVPKKMLKKYKKLFKGKGQKKTVKVK